MLWWGGGRTSLLISITYFSNFFFFFFPCLSNISLEFLVAYMNCKSPTFWILIIPTTEFFFVWKALRKWKLIRKQMRHHDHWMAPNRCDGKQETREMLKFSLDVGSLILDGITRKMAPLASTSDSPEPMLNPAAVTGQIWPFTTYQRWVKFLSWHGTPENKGYVNWSQVRRYIYIYQFAWVMILSVRFA